MSEERGVFGGDVLAKAKNKAVLAEQRGWTLAAMPFWAAAFAWILLAVAQELRRLRKAVEEVT